MNSLIVDVAGALSMLGITLFFPLNIFFSIVLRKRRVAITEEIVANVPEHMQERIRFGIDSNMSWVFGSLGLYIWFSWLLFKFGWHVTPEQFSKWHKAIKRAYGSYIHLAYVSCFGANIFSIGFLIFIFVRD